MRGKIGEWTDRERVELLLEGARQFGNTLDERRIYQSLRELVAGHMPLDGLVVSSFDPDTERINCEYGWADGKELDVSTYPPIAWDRSGGGMQSRVILSGKAEIFNVAQEVKDASTPYVEAGPNGEPKPVSSQPAAKSAMMAPMILEGKVTGVVQAMSDTPDAYSEDDLDVLVALATQMSAAWHHSRLYRQAEERGRMIDRIVGTSPDMIYIFDLRTGQSTFSNGRLARMLGYTEAELKEISLAELVHPDDFARLPDWWAGFQTVDDGEILEHEYRVRSNTGEWRWFLNRDTPFERDAEGKVIRILGLGRDITARKEQEELLERMVAQRTGELEAAVKELEGFTYSVSHDLRGPLRAISGASMILREDFSEALPDEARHLLSRQADAAKRMGALIDDLLKLSRLGRQELNPEWFDFSAMASEVALELRSIDRVTIQEDMEAFGDPRLVKFVLLNLMENAVKFSPDGGPVRILAEGETFSVADEGIGFDMEYAPKIFRPFERLVHDDQYPGTGIGLANAHRIVQRHGGKIWAESEPGKGSTFYFTLPAGKRSDD
ncbi:MAG TPA: ATP-binding protein [Fimbriimonadaceae bacterium]|nr:ATP-binding protein [Fimbriimonadaceae bacterium]